MSRSKKSRSLKGKANIRTGKKEDFKKWREEQSALGIVGPKSAAHKKKDKKRKEQAAKKLARMGVTKADS
ncbi:hypothetical protein [Oceanospirillum sp.]|uniref:hypothetical protein n=1 Tax=Oceanospirillum sp. TaxID=2021254 RepID=UPI003A9276B8